MSLESGVVNGLTAEAIQFLARMMGASTSAASEISEVPFQVMAQKRLGISDAKLAENMVMVHLPSGYSWLVPALRGKENPITAVAHFSQYWISNQAKTTLLSAGVSRQEAGVASALLWNGLGFGVSDLQDRIDGVARPIKESIAAGKDLSRLESTETTCIEPLIKFKSSLVK